MDATTYTVTDGDDRFDVTSLRPAHADRYILFAAGRGGNPGRHRGLLEAFADRGAIVIAPHFEMLQSPVPTGADLRERVRRLEVAMNRFCEADRPTSGVGHSIGTVALLMLAGATATTFAGERITGDAGHHLERLVLFAPPTAFFRPPGALDAVRTPLQVWAGGQDTITPPSHAVFLRQALPEQVPVDMHLIEEAGHFTFMNDLPPQVTDPHPDRAAFLALLASETNRFLQPDPAERAAG